MLSNGGKFKETTTMNGNCGKTASKSTNGNADGIQSLENGQTNGTTGNGNWAKGVKKNKRSSFDGPNNLLEIIKTKDDQIWKLEVDNKRLKAEFQTIRQCESDLRQQLTAYVSVEKSLKANIASHQNDIENLHKKLQTVQQVKQQDKQNIQRLEKLIEDEKRKCKASSDLQAVSEKKARMAEEHAARANAIAEAVRNVCSESCRQRQREVDLDISNLRKELTAKDEHMQIKEMVCITDASMTVFIVTK